MYVYWTATGVAAYLAGKERAFPARKARAA
jgi:hypothetical protein